MNMPGSEITSDPESCVPQDSSHATPAKQTTLNELRQQLQVVYGQIQEAEYRLSIMYWRLGRLLELARAHFKYGEWNGFLDSQGVDYSRASRARAIYRSFGAEAQVAEMTVDQAYSCRVRRTSRQRASNAAVPCANTVGALLQTITDDARSLAVECRSFTIDEAENALPQIDAVIDLLNELRQSLVTQVDSRQSAVTRAA